MVFKYAMEGGSMKRLVLLVALATIFCGCANPMLVDIHNGTFCNSTNVEAYADKHEITYQQALNELRRQSDEMWQREAGQMKADGAYGKSENGLQAGL